MLYIGTYGAFGNLIASSGSTENSYGFAGEQFDSELGHYYLRARYYDQSSGRFTRKDDYEGRLGDPLTLHKYIYANANPVNGIDPSGLITLWEGQRAHDAIGEDFVFRSYGNRREYDQNFRGGRRLTVKRVLQEADGLPFGFPGLNASRVDLADYTDHVFFEIKPTNRILEGLAQVGIYYLALNYAPGQTNQWLPGNFSHYVPTPVITTRNGEIILAYPPISGVLPYNMLNPKLTLTLLAGVTAYSISLLISELLIRLASRSAALGFT